jgi:putative ABC transport system permease protein
MALILVLVSGGMLDTMNTLIGVQFQQVSTANLQIDYRQPVGEEQLAEAAAVDGIAAVESVISQPVSVQYEGAVYATLLTAYDSGTVMHGFITQGGDPVALPDDGVLIDEAITAQIPDLAPGATVELAFPALGTTVTTTVRDFSYQPLGTFVAASKAWASANIPGAAATTLLATTANGADSDQVRRDLLALPGVVSVVETSALADLYQQFAGLFYIFIGAMLALGGAMAFAIIFTTMSVNIVERQRELATLRAAGVRYRTLAGLVGGENLIVATFGVIPGLILGWLAADLMLQTYSSDQFTLDLQFRASTLVLSVGVIMLVAALSQWPGLRAIRRMDVAQVVRERAA